MAARRAAEASGHPGGVAQALESIGAGERNRTLDLRITSALLYQLSYTGNVGRCTPQPVLLAWTRMARLHYP